MSGSVTLENVLLIYTDGSSQPHPRRGGAGVLFIHVDRLGEEHDVDTVSRPGAHGDTNNQMEIRAVIEALKRAEDQSCFSTVSRVLIRSDSMYVVTCHRKALTYWYDKKWKLRGGAPVANTELWKEFRKRYFALRKKKRVDIEWVPRKKNKRADTLAKSAANSPLVDKRSRVIARRKLSPQRTEVNSVPMLGQVMQIRMISSEWLPSHKLIEFRFEVVSPDSPYYQRVSLIRAPPTMNMRAAHTYEVRVNHETENPMIQELIREIEKPTPPIDDASAVS